MGGVYFLVTWEVFRKSTKTHYSCDFADCIIDVGTIFRRMSNTVNIIICGLIPRDECWWVNRLLMNRVNEILKYKCHKNVFAFIVQDYGWTLPNGSLGCSLFYKDILHLFEQWNVKLAKSMVSTLTARSYQINLSSKNRNLLLVISLKNLFQLLFLFPLIQEDDDDWPMFIDLSLNLDIVVTMSLLEVSLFRLMLVDMLNVVCSSNFSKQNACNVSSASKLVKSLTVSKPVCSTIATGL